MEKLQLSLDWALHPVTTEDFFRAYWETKALLVSRGDPGYFKDLPGLDEVDEIITATASGPVRSSDDGRLVRTDQNGAQAEQAIQVLDNGIPDIQDIYRAYHSGYTVVVNQVHRRSAPVALLCRALEAALHHRVAANLYLTPRGGQGFRPHVDTHDVFILQLHGVKEWHVSAPPSDLPLAAAKYGAIESLPDFHKYTLEPGDLLYLPRGFPHEAVTASSSSLHLTVGLHVHRWVDLVSEALQLLAAERVEFRKGLAPGFLNTSLDAERASKLAAELAEALTDDSLVERAKTRLGVKVLGDGKAAGRGQFRSIDAISNLSGESVVERAPGLLCRARSTSDGALIEFASNYVSGPAFLEPALTFIAGHQRFAVGELPGELSTGDKVDLVGRLVSEGLLHCTGERRGGEI
jgi:ribosomal protein L16 Arg81 hydroxylase